MKRLLVITDAPWVRNEVHAALYAPEFELLDLDTPDEAASRVIDDGVAAIVVDLQIGSMGGMAVIRSIRNTLAQKGHDPVPVVLLLDRTADVFLAGRAGAASWVLKPFTANELRTAVAGALEGSPYGSPMRTGSTPAEPTDDAVASVAATDTGTAAG